MHLVKWQKISRNKKGGKSWKLRDLKLHNRCVLFKQLWKLNDGKDVVWKSIVITKYGKEGSWDPKPVSSPYEDD